jgi:hypothetical protein
MSDQFYKTETLYCRQHIKEFTIYGSVILVLPVAVPVAIGQCCLFSISKLCLVLPVAVTLALGQCISELCLILPVAVPLAQGQCCL